MKTGIIVRGGALGLRLIGSPLYLEDDAIEDWITPGDGFSFGTKAEDRPAQSLPAIHFFSIPNHLFEQLWLKEIPKLTGVEGAPSEPERDDNDWRGLDMLSLLLETIESGFSKPVEAVFQSSSRGSDGSGDAQSDVCDDAAQSAQNAPEADSWRFGAWLNLDDCSRHAQVRVRDPKNSGGLSEPAVELEICQGQGILWQRDQLHLREMVKGTQEASNKLILLGGLAGAQSK